MAGLSLYYREELRFTFEQIKISITLDDNFKPIKVLMHETYKYLLRLRCLNKKVRISRLIVLQDIL